VELRAYQSEAIAAARDKLRTERSTLVVLPTGSGKTVIFAEIARLAIARGGRVLVLAHRTELLDQAAAKVRAAAPDLRVEREQASSRAGLARVVIASVQTLHRAPRLARWAPDAFSLVIVDEAHHVAAQSYQRVLAHFATAKILGFTATPDRADGVGLRGTFQSVAYARSMLDLVRLGYLVPISGRVVTVDGFDVAGVKIVRGDLQDKGLQEALDEPGVLDSIAKALLEHHGGRTTLVFVPGVAIAHDLAALLDAGPDAGGAVAIDGTTDAADRALRFELFQRGAKRFLVNVGIATEGVDIPRCGCVAVVRPTMSRSLFVQMVGRGTRLFPDKRDCLVLNFAPQNCRHKLIVPIDAMLGDELDDLTKQAIRELAEEQPDADIEQLIIDGTERANERRKRVHSIRARLEAWDPYGIIRVDEPDDDEPQISTGPWREAEQQYVVRAGLPEPVASGLSDAQLRALVRTLKRRMRAGLCTLKQARQLARRNLNPHVSIDDASIAMAALADAGWRATPIWLRTDPRFRLTAADGPNIVGALDVT